VYTLDTNAVIYLIKDDERATPVLSDILADPATPSYVSTATEAELFSFSQLSDAEIARIDVPHEVGRSHDRCYRSFNAEYAPDA
jgi:predicted nucleic acid-binding protein